MTAAAAHLAPAVHQGGIALATWLSAVGVFLGGLATIVSVRRKIREDSWARLVKALQVENNALRSECRRLRNALRRALERIGVAE